MRGWERGRAEARVLVTHALQAVDAGERFAVVLGLEVGGRSVPAGPDGGDARAFPWHYTLGDANPRNRAFVARALLEV